MRTAQAGIQTAVANVNSARVGVEKLRLLVNKDIIGPYAIKEAQFGSLISTTSTDPLTTVTGIADVYAYFSINEKTLLSFTRDIPGVTLQDKLAHLPDGQLLLADGTTYKHKGRVETTIGQINTQTGSSGFRASFVNPEGLLRNGSSGTVRVSRTVAKALLVPQSATYELQGKQFLYTLGPGNKVHNTQITVRPTPDGQFYVVQTGLKAGQTVVLEGVNGLKDNGQIKPRPARADSVFAATLGAKVGNENK